MGYTPYIEVILPNNATVEQVIVFGNREFDYSFDFFELKLEILNASSEVLHTETKELPAPTRNVDFQVPHIDYVKSIKIIGINDESHEPGLSEIEILGFFGSPIPDWIRNNAEWWAQGAIRDSDFISGIQYLIKEGIIQIPETEQTTTTEETEEIPSWIKNNAGWWAQGLITDEDFVKGIQYLVQQGIIQV